MKHRPVSSTRINVRSIKTLLITGGADKFSTPPRSPSKRINYFEIVGRTDKSSERPPWSKRKVKVRKLKKELNK